MNTKPTDMNQLIALQEYLQELYDGYELFQVEYNNMHRRSNMHRKEHITEYYLRWRDKMRAEIRRVELLLAKLLPGQLRIKNYELRMELQDSYPIEKKCLQNVAISEELVLDY